MFLEYDIFLQISATKWAAVYAHCGEYDRPSAGDIWVRRARDGVGEGARCCGCGRATKWGESGDRRGGKGGGRRDAHAERTGVENEVGEMGRKNVLKIQNATKMSYFRDDAFVQHVTFLSYFVAMR